MKKAIFECDLCHKEFEEKAITYASIYMCENGAAHERIDLCTECKDKMIEFIKDHQTEKGGGEG